MTTPAALPVGRHVLGSYPRYEQAQSVVDYLSDAGFPVETTAIVGADLRLVEKITGRLTKGRAAAAGAASGAWFGILVGLFVGLFAASGTALIALLLYGVILGLIFGAVVGYAGHAFTGGRRDFTSMTGLAATRYEVLVDPEGAQEAERLLAQAPAV